MENKVIDVNAYGQREEDLFTTVTAQPWMTVHCQRCGRVVQDDGDLITLVENPRLVDERGGVPHIKHWGMSKICHQCKKTFDELFLKNKTMIRGGSTDGAYGKYILNELRDHIPEFYKLLQQAIRNKKKDN